MKGSQTEGALPNGVYVPIQLDDNFVKCLCGNGMNDNNMQLVYTISSAKFMLINQTSDNVKIEQCILENFITTSIADFESFAWAIKICEEDDNALELYGGMLEQIGAFPFLVSIPYYIPENDTSSSTYSLRKTNPLDSLREKIEEMRQQMLDNPTE